MANILAWLTSATFSSKPSESTAEPRNNIEDDWNMFEDLLEHDDDDKSSIHTIEQVKLAKSVLSEKSQSVTTTHEINGIPISLSVIESTIANINKKEQQPTSKVHPTIAQLKNKELKVNKYKKRRELQRKSDGRPF